MRLGADTLIKYYTDELVLGDAKATAKVAQSLFNKAVGGDVASMIFWMKARAKWSERQIQIDTGPGTGERSITIIGGLPED